MDLDEVKALLGITKEDASKDAILEFLYRRVESRVLSYCNLKVIPKGLKDTVTSMIIDAYRECSYGQEQAESEVKSISRGDISYSYATPTQLAVERIKNPSFISNYKSELNRYRRVGGWR